MSTALNKNENNANTITTKTITTDSQDNKEEFCESCEDQKILTDLKECARVHLDNGKFQEALDCYHKIIEIGGDDVLVYSNMAYLYLKHLPDWSECEYYGSKSLRGNTNLRAAYWMALLYSQRENYIQALKFSMWYYEWEIDNNRKNQGRHLMNQLIDSVHKHNGYEIFVAEDDSGSIQFTYVFDTNVSPSMKETKKIKQALIQTNQSGIIVWDVKENKEITLYTSSKEKHANHKFALRLDNNSAIPKLFKKCYPKTMLLASSPAHIYFLADGQESVPQFEASWNF